MNLENIDIYWVMIGLSLTIILSYIFNYISHLTRIPSVILLIVTGFVVSIFVPIEALHLEPFLKFLGAVGLIMIVLEASLDLELKKEKRKLMIKAIFSALILLLVNAITIAYIIQFFFSVPFNQALFYAVPLSIMSSAIIIPSVQHLDEKKKEFLIYEASFSDIFGIMFFYFLQDSLKVDTTADLMVGISTNIIITIIVSFILGYLVILLVQRVTGHVKLFLPIAVLILLYSLGKLFHLSSLIFILVFGLMINNRNMFFRGSLLRLIKKEKFSDTLEDLKTLTLESSFLVRTFFFIIFGMTITAEGINDPMVYVIGIGSIVILAGTRYGYLSVFMRKSINPVFHVAPRGLITILLFFAIPEEVAIEGFRPAILLMVILVSNLIMTYGLMKYEPVARVEEDENHQVGDSVELHGTNEDTNGDDRE